MRCGTILVSFIGSWSLCPWIIVSSGQAFLNFMGAHSVLMAFMTGILSINYWLVEHWRYDVPAFYNPRGIYCYGQYSTNWRAVVATFAIITPLLPALANKVNSKIHLATGLKHIFAVIWLYDFFLSVAVYYALNLFFPDKESMISQVVTGFDYTEGLEADCERYLSSSKSVKNFKDNVEAIFTEKASA